MNERERRELAADIATRVRMYSWQPLPEPLIDAMSPYDWYEARSLPGGRASDYVVMTVRWLGQPQRLELSFDVNGLCNVGRILWTPDRAIEKPL